MKVSYLKKARHLIEAFFVWMAFILFHYILPPKASFGFGGWLARNVGPLLPRSNRARNNLNKCFPHLSKKERESLIRDMWDNYGRLAAEYSSPDAFWDGKTLKNIEIVGLEHLQEFRDDGKPGIMFSAHTGNWQMITLAAQSVGFDLTQMYRNANNPYVDDLMLRCQKLAVKHVITKKGSGPRDLYSLIKRGDHALLLIDQKMGEGISVPFLGRNAMTAKGVARMYLNQNVPLLPARSERIDGTKFRVTFYPMIDFKPSGEHSKDMYDLLLHVNNIVSGWILECPSQWLWVHRRWHDA